MPEQKPTLEEARAIVELALPDSCIGCEVRVLVEEIDRLTQELCDRNIDITDLEVDIQFLKATKADYLHLIETLKIVHDLKTCPDEECTLCSVIHCPDHEPLHFHHDGCPSCDALEPAPSGVSSWLE